MARTNNLNDFLTDVAGAIKEKTGDSTAIPASQFDTKIRSIETGGNYQAKTVEYTTNGTRQIVPDTNYDALSEVNVTVNVATPAPVLQNKTATQNGSYSADPGYDGLGTVLVNVQGQINNQDKTITQNGQYTADSGYTGLGTVTVNVPSGSGDVKLFETEQAMQADPSPSEGDLAVIYRSEIQNWDGQEAVKGFTFPNTVTMSEAVANEFYGYGMASTSTGYCEWDGYVSSSGASFRFRTRTGEIYEEYNSSDGLTYTKTNGEDIVELFDTPVEMEAYEYDQRLGNFMQIGSYYFGGLYEYKEATKVDTTHFLGTKVNSDSTKEDIYIENLQVDYSAIEQEAGWSGEETAAKAEVAIVGAFTTSQSLDNKTVINPTTFYKLYSRAPSSVYSTSIVQEGNKFYLATYSTASNVTNYLITVTNGVASLSYIPASDFVQSSISGYYYYPNIQLDYAIGFFDNNNSSQGFYDSGIHTSTTTVYLPSPGENAPESKYCRTYNEFEYVATRNQFTLKDNSELLTNIIAYGQGVFTGDGSIWNKITNTALWSNILNHTPPTSTSTIYNGETNVLLSKSLPDNKLYGFVFEKPESPLATTAVINVEKHNYTNPTTEIGYYAFESPFIVNTGNYVYCFTLNYNASKMNVARYTLSNNTMLYDRSVDITQTGLKYGHACYRYDDVNGKVYIGVYGGYPNYTTAYMFVFDIATMTITNSYSKAIGSGSGNNGTVNYIDLATNTAYLTYTYSSTTAYYKWNWVNNTSSTVTAYPYTNYCILPETDNATYLLYKDGNNAKIVRKSDFSTIMNITTLTGKTLLSTVRPIWINNICYLIDNKFVIKIDVDNNTCTAVNNDLTFSGNYALVGTNSYAETNDYIYFVLSYTHSINRPGSKAIYRLNKTTLALDSINANSTDFTLLFANSNHVLTTITQTFGKNIGKYDSQYDDFSYTNKLIFGYTKSMYDCNGIFALRGGDYDNVTNQGYMSSTMMNTLIMADNNS